MDVWTQAAREADLTILLPGDLPMFFRRIPAGIFRVGSRRFSASEEPRHRVQIHSDFYLGTFVVTQEQYRAVAARCPALKKRPTPSHFKGARRPVEEVNWHDARAFCEQLAQSKALPPAIAEVRLPNEAEWERACRGGTETEYYSGDGDAALRGVAWYGRNSKYETHPVDEQGEEHPYGLYGMHGNVWEWCADVWDAQAYRKRDNGWIAREWTLDDAGDEAEYLTDEDRERKNALRVLRGGSWYFTAWVCRAAFRYRLRPVVRDWVFGFRVCLVPGPIGTERGAPTVTSTGAEPAPGDGGRRMSPESEGAGGAGAGRARTGNPAKRAKMEKPK